MARRSVVLSKIGAIGLLWPLTVLALLAGPIEAQSAPAVSEESAISKECQTPGVKLPLDKPLPNTLAALKERKVIKILTIGASASAGMDPASGGYQDIIEETLERIVPGLDVQIIDRGVSGELARNAAQRLKTEVALTEPNLVLWQVGSNDALAQIPVEDFAETITDTVHWLKEHNIDVVLVGLHYVSNLRTDPHYQSIRATLSRVADREKIIRISRYEAMEMMERMHSASAADRFNAFALSEENYSCIAEYVVRAITSAIFLKRHKTQTTN
jgi:lysophospholipase L1-like esterase